MNNKKLGTDFEKNMCKLLAFMGYWVHFIVPNTRGAQPFDVIAVKDGRALAINCKTSVTHRFNISRIEDNQHMAFKKWMKCGNSTPLLAILYDDKVYFIPYSRFESENIVDLKKEEPLIEDFEDIISEI